MDKRIKDLTGKKFGKLTVSKYSPRRSRTGVKKTCWDCICDCGNTTNVDGNNLKRNLVKSCGCSFKGCQRKDLTDKVFGELTVISRGDSNGKTSYWNTKCSCGTETIVATNKLTTGYTRSCGCRGRGSQTHGTIYGIYDDLDNLVYIGQTVRYKLKNRLKGHLYKPSGNMKEWFDSIDYKPTIKPLLEDQPIEYLNKLEKKLIQSMSKEHNLLNITYNVL